MISAICIFLFIGYCAAMSALATLISAFDMSSAPRPKIEYIIYIAFAFVLVPYDIIKIMINFMLKRY